MAGVNEAARKSVGLDTIPSNEVSTVRRIEDKISRLEESQSKLQLEVDMLDKQLELERKTRALLETEIAKSRAFQDRFESALVTLESMIELKEIQKTDKDKFQEENK